MEFAYPAAFGLLFIAIPLLWAARRKPAAVPLITTAGVLSARPTVRTRLLWLPPALRIAGCALLVVAIARPREGNAETVVPVEGVDIVLALDISTSMAGSLVDGPSRIEASKEVIADFIETREDDRLGLVAFSEFAVPVVPPTLDHEALARIVATVDEEFILGTRTGIGLAISESLRLLVNSNAASRVVIVLTDGIENVNVVSPEQAAEFSRTIGVRLYTVGILDPARFDGGIDAELLTAVAETTGGRFFPVESAVELEQVYEEIGNLETSSVEEDRFIDYTEYGPWFALAGAILLVFDISLRTSWLRRTGL